MCLDTESKGVLYPKTCHNFEKSFSTQAVLVCNNTISIKKLWCCGVVLREYDRVI